MKKKGNLAKRLLIYVFSLLMLTLYTTNCVSYDEDIDDIYKQLEELRADIKEIKDKIAASHFITDVLSIPGGMRVTFDDGTVHNIIDGTNGQDGAPGTQWSIVDSMWRVNGDPYLIDGLPVRAIPRDGKQGETAPSPEIIYDESDAKYYWVIYKWDDATNDFIPNTLKTMPVYNYETFVVDQGIFYELHIWLKDSPTATTGKYEIIPLPKSSNSPNPYFLEFLGYYRTKTPGNPISMTIIRDYIEYFYWHIGKIRTEIDENDIILKWEGRKTVEPGQVLTTLERDSAVAIIRTNLPKTSWKLTLKNSHDGLLPISFGNPVKHTGAFTKALGNDSIYILPMDGTKDPYPSANAYRNTVKPDGNDLVYSLIDTITGINSGYKAFITPNQGSSGNLGGEVSVRDIDEQTGTNKEYEVTRERDIKIRFNSPDYLYDYYVEAVDPTLAEKFGFTVNKPNGTFKVTTVDPDEESFEVIIYKLNYSGYFYRDTVVIKPKQ
jgi:hypothetical protein